MEPEDPKDWHKKLIKMEQDYILNNRDNIDNFLDDIWSNCELEPPNLSEEFSNTLFGVNDQQINPQSVIKQETFTEESNLCTWHENFIMKDEVVNDGSILNIQGENIQGARKRNEGSSSRSVERAEIRRQRMLKNRASAARSRARTLIRRTNLEMEVKQYREENAMLRQKNRASEHEKEREQTRAEGKVWRCKSCSW